MEAFMKSLNIVVVLIGVTLVGAMNRICVAADAPAAPATRPTIFVCGDSTSKYSGSETMENLSARGGKSMAGWGTPIAQFFDPAKVAISNVGQAGTSSMSYYNGNWPRVLPRIQAGDFVLLVFGINDGMTLQGTGDETREGRGGQLEHTYGWYMAKMATDAKEKGAHVYFLTVTTRNMWTNPKAQFKDATPVGELPADYDPKQDRIERGTGEGRFTRQTKEVAAKLHVPVFDLTNACADLYEKLGREETNKFYLDHNHTYLTGAETVASCIVSGLKAFKDSPFVPMLSEKGKAIPNADAKYVIDNLPAAPAAK
jgi:rhamnogalacturonan acetylesterase